MPPTEIELVIQSLISWKYTELHIEALHSRQTQPINEIKYQNWFVKFASHRII